MHRRTLVVVSILAAVTALAGVSGGLAAARDDSRSRRTVPAVTVPVLLTIAGGEATIDPISGTDRFRLRILGTGNDVTWFTDHPARRVGHMRADDLASEWSRVFGAEAPLTALTLRQDGQTFTYVVEATRPSYQNGVLAISIEPMTAALGALPSAADEVTIFIDDAGATLPKNPADHPVALREVSAEVDDSEFASTGGRVRSDPPVSGSDWSFQAIVQPSDPSKFIGKSQLNGAGSAPQDDFIYSMPASALVSDFSDHHLDVVNSGVYLIGHTAVDSGD